MIHSSYKSHSRSQVGFTLLELLVVFSIITILSATGLAAYVEFSQAQIFNTNVLVVQTMLYTAKLRAQSQVIQSAAAATYCSSPHTLKSFGVEICGGGTCNDTTKTSYALYALCSNGTRALIESKKLPANMYFENASTNKFPQFSILSGVVALVNTAGKDSIVISDGDWCQQIEINELGTINRRDKSKIPC